MSYVLWYGRRAAFFSAICLLSIAFIPCLVSSPAFGQIGLSDVLGIPPDTTAYPIPGVGFVNLNNGNLHIEIPLRTVADRNGAKVTTSLTYDNSIWETIEEPAQSGPGTVPFWVSAASPYLKSWAGNLVVSTNPLFFTNVKYTNSTYVCGSSTIPQYSGWVFTDAHGTLHAFPPGMYTEMSGGTGCPDVPTIQAVAADGSGYWLKVSNYTSGVVYDMHGNVVGQGPDTNGNIAPSASGDKLGRPTNLPSNFTPSYETIYVWTDFQSPGATELGPVSGNALASLTLPGGRSYSFQYDDAGPPNGQGVYNSNQQGHYGNLTGITLPTGGQISIVSEVAEQAGLALVVKQITTPDGTWNFSYAPIRNVGNQIYPGMITATAPADPITGVAPQTTWLTGSSGLASYTVSTYSGSATGTPLRTTTTVNPQLPTSITTTLDTGQSSKVTYSYADACTPRVSSKKEYDYSGSLLRETDVSYNTTASDNANLCKQWNGEPPWNSNYLKNGRHITDIASSVTLYGPGGCCTSPVAQTNYTYDSTALSTTSGSVLGVAGPSVLGLADHDDVNFGSTMTVRGNPTVVSQMTGSNQFITTQTNYYNILGELVKSVDGNGNATAFDFTDSWNNASCFPSSVFAYPTTVTNALNQRTKTTYNSCDGSVASIKDQNDINAARSGTVLTYDGLQRVTNEALPDGGNRQTNYGGSATPEVITTTVTATPTPNQVSTVTLDGLGRSFTVVSPNGATVGRTYDQNGRLQSVTNPYFTLQDSTYGQTSYVYDALGRKTLQCQPDNLGGERTAYCDGGDSYLSWSYSGNVVTFTDEVGNLVGGGRNQWKTTTDAGGRLTKVLEPNPAIPTSPLETDYAYDALGNLTRVDQWGGASGSVGERLRLFYYDGLSRLLAANNPENASSISPAALTCPGVSTGKWSTCYAYDANGNLTSKEDNRAASIGLTYDVLNRLTTKTYTTSGSVTPTPTAHFAYDQASVAVGSITPALVNTTGRLSSEYAGPTAPGVAMKAFSYDAMGRNTAAYECWGAECAMANGTRSLGRQYDLAGNTLFLDGGAGQTFTYTLNSVGQVYSVSTTQNGVTNGLSQTAAYSPWGALTARNAINLWTYDNRMRLSTHTWIHVANTLFSQTLQYEPNSNVSSSSETVASNSWTWNYSYDSLNRLSTAVSTALQEGCQESYDNWGNRTSQAPYGGTGYTCNSVSPTPNTNNQYGSLAYDAAGNMTHDLSGNVYTYDAEDRITSVTSGGTTTNYTYRPDGLRATKQTGSLTYYYSYDYDGSLIVRYKSGTGINGVVPYNQEVWLGGEHLATIPGVTNASSHAAVDQVGSERVEADGSSNIYASMDYLPFGDGQAVTGNTQTTIRFAGKELDTESGDYYFGARYYSPTMGRFLSPDPSGLNYADINNPQSFNLYSYALNNPLKFVDPTGLYCDYSDHNDPASGFDQSQFDYNSNSGECGTNGGQWVNDAYTQNGADIAGRPQYAVTAIGTPPAPGTDLDYDTRVAYDTQWLQAQNPSQTGDPSLTLAIAVMSQGIPKVCAIGFAGNVGKYKVGVSASGSGVGGNVNGHSAGTESPQSAGVDMRSASPLFKTVPVGVYLSPSDPSGNSVSSVSGDVGVKAKVGPVKLNVKGSVYANLGTYTPNLSDPQNCP